MLKSLYDFYKTSLLMQHMSLQTICDNIEINLIDAIIDYLIIE